jgi:hypothetical protein
MVVERRLRKNKSAGEHEFNKCFTAGRVSRSENGFAARCKPFSRGALSRSPLPGARRAATRPAQQAPAHSHGA